MKMIQNNNYYCSCNMFSDCKKSNCDCCQGIKKITPMRITNFSGQSSISYRVGTYLEFIQSMISSISLSQTILSKKLTVRSSSNDLALALLDIWAIVSDVLSFYQERIANECFLRTATEIKSILELARTIGYELRPAVAASTFLAFTLENTPGVISKTTITV